MYCWIVSINVRNCPIGRGMLRSSVGPSVGTEAMLTLGCSLSSLVASNLCRVGMFPSISQNSSAINTALARVACGLAKNW